MPLQIKGDTSEERMVPVHNPMYRVCSALAIAPATLLLAGRWTTSSGSIITLVRAGDTISAEQIVSVALLSIAIPVLCVAKYYLLRSISRNQ